MLTHMWFCDRGIIIIRPIINIIIIYSCEYLIHVTKNTTVHGYHDTWNDDILSSAI